MLSMSHAVIDSGASGEHELRRTILRRDPRRRARTAAVHAPAAAGTRAEPDGGERSACQPAGSQ